MKSKLRYYYSRSSTSSLSNASQRGSTESSAAIDLVDLYYNYCLMGTYGLLLLLCGLAFAHGWKMVGRRGLGLPALSLVFVASVCSLRLLSYAGDSEFGLVSHLATCSCCSAVWCILLAIYVKFHPSDRAVNKGGVPWKWRYTSLGVNIFTYVLVTVIALVTGNLKRKAHNHSDSSNFYCECSDPVDVLDNTLLLVVTISFLIVAFAGYRITRQCYQELVEKKSKILLVLLVLISIGCLYRALNDLVTAIWPMSPMSGKANNYSSMAKEVMPCYAIVVAVFVLHKQKPCECCEEDITKDPAFKEVRGLQNLKIIGSGSYGTVYSATIAFQRLGQLWHRNIINLWGWTKITNELGIVLDFAEKGSLRKVLSNKKELSLELCERVRMALDVATGMAFVHSKNLIHRDLKPENILVDKNFCCKICDFGSAIDLKHSSSCHSTAGTTPVFSAPEVIVSGAEYTQQYDVFSFSMVLWVLLNHGDHPFSKELQNIPVEQRHQWFIEAAKQQYRPSIPHEADLEMETLLVRCWAQDPKVRPTFTEIVTILTTYCADKRQHLITRHPPTYTTTTTTCGAIFQGESNICLLEGISALGDRDSNKVNTQELTDVHIDPKTPMGPEEYCCNDSIVNPSTPLRNYGTVPTTKSVNNCDTKTPGCNKNTSH
ncbi:Serine/threonine-protein kinase HT1 [Pelomyxa schiedti]|nr:Serine/threonine-protein kinase HT1 [Pelomyxa schiedti]